MCDGKILTQDTATFMVTHIFNKLNLGSLVSHAAKQMYWHWVEVKDSLEFIYRVPSKEMEKEMTTRSYILA